MEKRVTIDPEPKTIYDDIQSGDRVMWFDNTGVIQSIDWEYKRPIRVREDITGRETRLNMCRKIITNE